MCRITIVLLYFLHLNSALGQDTFIKVIDRDETRTGRQLIEYNDRLFTLITGVCNNLTQCCEVMEITDQGNVIWTKTLPWIDPSSRSMVINNDIITLSGNNNPEQVEFYLHQMSINGGDSITTYIIDDPSVDLDRMFVLNTIYYNDKFLIAGTGNIANTNLDNSIIYVVDELSGEVDTLLMIDQQNRSSAIWDLLEDSEGNINAFIHQDTQGGSDFRSIIKLDSNFNIIWKYTSEEDIFNNSAPKGCILEDSKLAYVTGSTGGESQTHAIRAINQDSSIAWQFDWPDINSFQRELFSLELASDGSIFTTGMYGWTTLSTPLRDIPFIAKISAEGELIWERAFVQFDEEGELKRGLLFDVEELADGSLLALGQQRNENGDILIMKLMADGCLDVDDCELHNMYTDVSDIVIGNAEVTVYPNPILDAVQIKSEIEFERLKIYDLDGRLLQDLPFSNSINLSTLAHGNYFIKLITSDGRAALKQIVKM